MQIKLSDELRSQLERVAKRVGWGADQIMAMALIEWLERHGEAVDRTPDDLLGSVLRMTGRLNELTVLTSNIIRERLRAQEKQTTDTE